MDIGSSPPIGEGAEPCCSLTKGINSFLPATTSSSKTRAMKPNTVLEAHLFLRAEPILVEVGLSLPFWQLKGLPKKPPLLWLCLQVPMQPRRWWLGAYFGLVVPYSPKKAWHKAGCW